MYPKDWRIANPALPLPSRPAAVEAPIGAPRIEEASETEIARRYHLVLLDDDHHSYAYVIEMLGAIFGYGREKAFALARIVDTAGRVIVQTGSHDEVTVNQGRIHTYGADPRIPASRGSMSAIIEEAD